MKLLGQDFNAVIFDMDGTLIDSTGIWHEIDKAFFAKRGMEIPSEYAQHIVHLGLTQAAIYTKETYGFRESVQEIIDEWHNMSIDMYRYHVPLKPGALELLKLFKANNIKMAIATANDDRLYRPCLERLGIEEYFDEVADVNSAKEGKQSSKIYLDLAKKLGSEPRNTLVLEDMPTCVKTVYKAGFLTVAVFDNASKEYDAQKKRDSHLFIKDFFELIERLK